MFLETQPSNERLARLIRIYRSPLPRRPGMPSAITHTHTRPTATIVGRSAPPQVSAPPALPPPQPAPAPPPPPPPVHVLTRPSRRMSPIMRSKSPVKVVRQADPSPKRPIINDTINIERLKLARDEAEKAMKVRD